MNWRKSVTLSFLPLLVFLGFILADKQKVKKPESKRVVASVSPQEKKASKKTISRKVVSVFQEKKNQNVILKNRIPQSVESTFNKNSSIILTKGYEFLNDVASMPKKQYTPDMGEILVESNGYVFFRADSGHNYHPVAISKLNNKLYPVSSILHIKGATQELRSSVLAQGHKEYYYHAPLKLLSIKTESGETMKTYSQLKARGFKVELEVMKPQHQTF